MSDAALVRDYAERSARSRHGPALATRRSSPGLGTPVSPGARGAAGSARFAGDARRHPARGLLTRAGGAAAAGRWATGVHQGRWPHPNPDTPALLRAEAQITAALPASAPSPRLLWSYDDQGWVALAFEDIQGKLPTLPWQPGELQRVLEVVAELAVTLTPAPVAAPSVATRLGAALTSAARHCGPTCWPRGWSTNST